MNSVFFALQEAISLKGKGRKRNTSLGLTMSCARGVHIQDVFKRQCMPLMYDSLHYKAQTGKGEPTHTNYIKYIHSINNRLIY